MKNAVSELCKKAYKAVDADDILAFIGLSLLFYGLYSIYKPAAFVGVGIILFILAVLPSFLRGE